MRLETSYVFRRSAKSQALALFGLLGAPFLMGASATAEKVVGSPLALIAMVASVTLRVVLDKAGAGAADDELLAALDDVEDERAAAT